jgi:outer membrane protein TolC
MFLLGAAAFASIAAAQTASDQTPGFVQIPGGHWWERLGLPYQAPYLTQVSFENSPRLENLLRDGKLILSLDDAIALTLENNLDIELQRFDRGIASSDLLRARGGGTLRGVPFTINEVAPGVGGPASPILNLPATGAPFSTAVSTSLPELTSIVGAQSSAAITSSTPLSNGPAIPMFDQALVGQFSVQHQTQMQTNMSVSDSGALFGRSTLGTFGFQRGFSTGAQFSAGFSASSQRNNAVNSAYNPYSASNLSLNLTQPLLRGFGPPVNQRFIRIARNNQQVSDLVFRQQVISTVYGVIRLYYDLATLQEDVQVKKQTLALAQKLYDDNKEKVDQGTLAPIELTRSQAQMASSRQDLANSEGFEAQQELILKNVLSRSSTADTTFREAQVVPTTEIPIPAHEDLQPIQDLVAAAYKNRPELEEGRLQLANSEISLQGSRNALKPELDLVVTAQNSGLAGVLNPLLPSGALVDETLLGGFGTLLDQLFTGNHPSYGVGIQLSLPWHNRIAQGDYARDEIQFRQTEVRFQQLQNQIRLEVESALTALRRSRAAYNAAVEARILQEQSVQIELEKYASGVSTNFLVMQYQSFLAQARSTEVAAKSVYAKAQTALERAVGMTLQNHNISVDEALRGQVSRAPAPQR